MDLNKLKCENCHFIWKQLTEKADEQLSLKSI